jgi:hypothetical protein
VANSKSLDIFNYEFNWDAPNEVDLLIEYKEVCCEKFKKKGERKCKRCPKRRP